MWDSQSTRWYYLMGRRVGPAGSQVGHLAYGWSRSADPTDLTSGWCHQDIDTGALFNDYPKLGDNDTHLAFGTNVYPANGFQTSATSRVWTVPKPANGDTTCPASVSGIQSFGRPASPLTTADGSRAFTPVPTNTVDSSGNGYVVARSSFSVMAWHVNPSGVLVEDGNVDVGFTASPPDIPQPNVGCTGTCDRLDSLDGRLTQAVSVKDPDAGGSQAVWTQHAILDPVGTGRSVVRWYELLPGACAGGGCSASALRQQGEVKDPDHHVFNGAISPTTSGNKAVIHYNVGSATLAAEIRARSRLSDTALGEMGAEITLDTSVGSLDDYTCGIRDTRPACNWGDYAGATPDPADPRLVWGSNQSIGPVTPGAAHWRTRNFALQPAVVLGASFTVSPNPAPVGQGVSYDGSASTSADPDATIARYQWDLDGDGAFERDTGATPTTSRTYTTPATLNVKLRVTDSRGATSETTRALRINAPPAASFTATPSPAGPEPSVSFDGSASVDPDGIIARYQWDLDGDGSFETDTGATPTTSRIYTMPATLKIKLRVTDSDGATSETTGSLVVTRTSPKPVPVSRSFPGCAATATVRPGTVANDTITGTPAGDRIFTGAGDDTVSGLAGDDCIDLGAGTDRGDGGLGNDLILGGAGRDRLHGGSGRDRLRGGAGGDRILGGASRDSISGGSGNDRIYARDRKRDRIRCGRGRDSVVAADRVARDCERIMRRR